MTRFLEAWSEKKNGLGVKGKKREAKVNKNICKPKQPSVTKRIARIGLNTGVANLKIRTFTNLRIVTD